MLAILLALCFSCIQGAVKHDADTDQVYAAVIRHYFPMPSGKSANSMQLVILDTTTVYFCDSVNQATCSAEIRNSLTRMLNPADKNDLLKDFVERNNTKEPLSKTFPTDGPKIWISTAEEKAIFENKEHDGWDVFEMKYPGAPGILSFSRIGFNKLGNRALVYYVHSCGWTCGEGDYVLLKKVAGKWTVADTEMIVIS